MQVVIAKDFHEMSKKAADIVSNLIQSKPDCALCLPTGDTPSVFYRELVDAAKKSVVDFSDVKTFNLDEYVGLSKSDKSSYAFYMLSKLFSPANVPLGNTNIPNGMAEDVDAECRRYEKSIEDAGGIDLAVLGIGVNGHIGFNEPGTPFNSKCHVTDLTDDTIQANVRHFANVSDMPTEAMTMGIDTIFRSRKILLLATGPKKAEAIQRLVNGEVTPDFPASILQTHDDFTLIIDEAAASELIKAGYRDQKISDFTIYFGDSLPKDKNVVVISPHPDDSAIGAGGTMSLLTENNDVTTFVMAAGHRANMPKLNKTERIRKRRDEANNEADVLGVKCEFLNLGFYNKDAVTDADVEKVYSKLAKIKPDMVFMTTANDPHPTHQMSTEIAVRAVKRYVAEAKTTLELWNYESPWGLFQPGSFNALVQLPAKAMRRKLKAVRQHESQVKRTPFDKVSEAMSVMRGVIVPEQVLGGFGEKPQKLEDHAEVFRIETITHEKKLVESLSGVRGIYGSELTDEIAEAYAFAYGSWLRNKVGVNPRVVVGRDSRPSGKRLVESMTRGLERANCHVFRVGVGTTPLIQLEVRQHESDGGVIITASHNEPDWNGFKFLGSDGGILKSSDMDVVIKSFHARQPKVEQEAVDHYIQYVNETLGSKVIKQIRDANLKVVVDPNGGAMIVMIKKLFEYMNIETVELNMDLGVFKHKVEPTRDALKHMGPIIDKNEADLGVAWDCDGDRVEMVLPGCRHISGHYILAMLVDEVLSGRVKNRVVVVSAATSQVVAEVAKQHKAKVVEVDVGEVNVVEKMYELGAPVGGEGSCGGGIVPPSRCRDGILTLFKVLSLMVKRGVPLNDIVNSYPKRYTLQKNIRTSEEAVKKIRGQIKDHYKGFKVIKRGGVTGSIKVTLSPNSFVMFRASKTEPEVLRVIADSPTKTASQKIVREAMGLFG
jgi:glucosamine-6-phosphate deaminase